MSCSVLTLFVKIPDGSPNILCQQWQLKPISGIKKVEDENSIGLTRTKYSVCSINYSQQESGKQQSGRLQLVAFRVPFLHTGFVQMGIWF